MLRRDFLKTAAGLFIPVAPAIIRPASAQMWPFPGPGRAAAGGGGGGYSGPGDLATFHTWVGLRAYSNATLGGNLVDVWGNTTSTTFTFVSNATTGAIELSAGGAAAFISGNSSTMFVNKMYDQTGNGRHFNWVGIGSAPLFSTTGAPPSNTTHAIQFGSGGSKLLRCTGFALSQPFSVNSVFRTTTSGSIQALQGESTNFAFGETAANNVRLYAGSSVTSGPAISTNTWYMAQGVANGASSVSTLDTTDTSVSPGTSAISSGHAYEVGSNDFTETFTGSKLEWGIIASAANGTLRGNLNSNAKTFWGY